MARTPVRKPRREETFRKQRAVERAAAAEVTFADLGLPDVLVDALADDHIIDPFPIQQAAIPDALAGADLLGRGQTGSGKTLAFSLPMIARLMDGRRPGKAPRAVILSPTRELAMQISKVVAPLAKRAGLFSILVAGGMSYTPQLKALSRGVDIIIATPGRLIDLTERGAADLSQVEVAILDEADQMCDMGFLPEVTALWDQIPAEAQHLLFSATLDRDVEGLAQRYLREPITHGVDPEGASVEAMDHQFWTVHPLDKLEIVSLVANRPGRTLVFVRTQVEADKVATALRSRGIMAGSLHGGLRQGARTRVMDAFRRGDLPVLVATDVAARGIHVDDVSLVVQADIAHDAKDYLHRAGRTARAGQAGRVLSLVAPRQRRRMEQISRQIGLDARPLRVRPGDEVLDEFGTDAPGPAIDEPSYEAVLAPRRAPSRARRSSPGAGRGRFEPRREREFRGDREPRRERGPRRERDDWNRDDRRPRDDRRERPDFADRPERPAYADRPDRGERPAREQRGGFGKRKDYGPRESTGKRDGFGKRDGGRPKRDGGWGKRPATGRGKRFGGGKPRA